MAAHVAFITPAIAELRFLLVERAPFDFLRFMQRVKPLFESAKFEASDAVRLKKLQEAVYVVCMGFAAGQPNSWPQKEAFILAELSWLETLAAEEADKPH